VGSGVERGFGEGVGGGVGHAFFELGAAGHGAFLFDGDAQVAEEVAFEVGYVFCAVEFCDVATLEEEPLAAGERVRRLRL
jgi:hypothetical protein